MISRISIQKAERQYIIAVVSLAVCLAIPFIISKSGFFRNLTWVYALVGIVMLSSVWIFGDMTNGSKISFNLSGITFQPSEFVKIIYLFFLAACLWKNTSLKRIIMTSVLAGIHVILLVLSTDLGSALIFFVCYVFVVYLATGKIRYLLAGLSGGCVAALVAYQIF
ncbi:MAG: FtsW/RodA/SpoVE family cell cycle protein, partial [bacterium]|nr:FtsW/RodA/SpoVE family cell cycle protein [bacterium]